jgi:hypothetical protein
MIDKRDSAAELIDRLMRKAPAYLDLITAETVEEFEAAFTSLLERAVIHLEQNKKNFRSLKEEGLTAALAGCLMAQGLTVMQEPNSNGHVDLRIEADHCTPARVKLGEAKIYSGPSKHIKGIGQLLGRYTTGRETAGLMINYVRKPDIKGITERLKAKIDSQLPEGQTGPCDSHLLKWSLTTTHLHSSGELISVDHIGFNLHV